MNAFQILLAKVLGGVILICLVVLGWNHHIKVVEKRGYDRAVAEGKIELQKEKDRALAVERDLRAQLSKEQRLAAEKETRHAQDLAAAQARVRSGADRLLCPKSREVRWPGPDADRPAASGPAPDGEGEAIVPDVAAEILGDAAAVAGLVRKFERLGHYFETCRAIANGDTPPLLPSPDTP